MAWSDYDKRRRAPRPKTHERERFRRVVLERAGYRCQVQGPTCARVATQADHVVPLAEGGAHDPANGQAICDPCHDRKIQAEAQRGRARWKRKPPRHPGLDATRPRRLFIWPAPLPHPLPPHRYRPRFA